MTSTQKLGHQIFYLIKTWGNATLRKQCILNVCQSLKLPGTDAKEGVVLASAWFPGVSVSIKGLTRNCISYPENTEPPPNRCFAYGEATDYVAHLLDQGSLQTGSKIEVTVDGKLCFCAEDGCNGVGSLKPFFLLSVALFLTTLLIK